MSYEIDTDFTESYIMPPYLEDWIPERHPARFIREFVNQIDVEQLGFQAPNNSKGRPRYAVQFLLRVWLYCWFERIRSFRDIERACYRDIGLIWLTGNRQPDHNTLWRFWRDNQKPLRKVFRKSSEVALKLDLVQMVLHAVDGTKILAASSRASGVHRSDLDKLLKEVDQNIEQMSQQLNAQSEQGHEEYLLKQQLADAKMLRSGIQQSLEQLDAAGVNRMQPKEPEVPMMKTSIRKEWAYNAQAVVDEASSIIVAQDVVLDESDNYQLVAMLDQVHDNLGAVAETTAADGGYEDGRQLAQAHKQGYNVAVNVQDHGERSPYHISHFVYDPSRDEWICPQGRRLSFETNVHDGEVLYRRYRCGDCRNCPVKLLCTKQSCRHLAVHQNYEVLRMHREKLKEYDASRALYKRKQIIEPRFGWIKQRLGFRRFSVRGLQKAKTQWAVVCTTWNLRRMWKLIWGERSEQRLQQLAV